MVLLASVAFVLKQTKRLDSHNWKQTVTSFFRSSHGTTLTIMLILDIGRRCRGKPWPKVSVCFFAKDTAMQDN